MMFNSSILQLILILIFLINFKLIQCCGPLGQGYGGLDPSYLLRNPQAMQPFISSMSPQQLLQTLPQAYPLAMQNPQLIPIVVNMLTPAQRYVLSNPSQYIPQYPQQQGGFPGGFPGGFGGPNFGGPQGGLFPQGLIPQGVPQGFIPG